MLVIGLAAALCWSPSSGVPARSVSAPRRYAARLTALAASAQAEEDILNLVASGASKGTLLARFAALEAATPTPSDLLLTASGVNAFDGRWLLRATIAAQVGEDDLGSSGVSNAVNASGIIVDTTKAPPVQVVDVASQRVANEIRFELPLGITGFVRVAGSFELDASNGRRALVEFDTLDVFTFGSETAEGQRVLRAGWLFKVVKMLKPSALNGDDSASWLDTTYLSPRVRLGRGNKGSVFILERCPPGPGQLDAWPLS